MADAQLRPHRHPDPRVRPDRQVRLLRGRARDRAAPTGGTPGRVLPAQGGADRPRDRRRQLRRLRARSRAVQEDLRGRSGRAERQGDNVAGAKPRVTLAPAGGGAGRSAARHPHPEEAESGDGAGHKRAAVRELRLFEGRRELLRERDRVRAAAGRDRRAVGAGRGGVQRADGDDGRFVAVSPVVRPFFDRFFRQVAWWRARTAAAARCNRTA